MVYMYHSFLIHSSADGHLGCFHVLAIINSAVMNIGVHQTPNLNFKNRAFTRKITNIYIYPHDMYICIYLKYISIIELIF